ncbi:MAG: DNA polymerase III subunit beta [Desulfitobacteriia bacterium]|jgi:DNA polymerase-3 subunit beta
MKILCTKEDLLKGVNTVQRAISSKSTLPILQGIRLHTENNLLWFEATDLEIGIRCSLPLEIEEQGAVVLPARLFSEIVRKLPDTPIRIESKDRNVEILYDNSNFIINGYDPEEYPEIAEIASPENIEISSSLFTNMIRKTVFACATEETRPVFTGVLLHIEKEKISLVSTDTHRLAFYKAVIPGNEKEFKGIIPSKTMQEVLRLLDEDQILNIQYNEGRIIFKFDSIQILTRLIEGQFPSYKQVIPQTCHTKLVVNSRNLLDTVERASLLSRDDYLKTNTVRFAIDNSMLNINQHSEMGKISEQINIEQEGEGVEISFNAKYITDVLKVIEAENVTMETSGAFNPCVFRPENEEDYLYLVLPLRN